MPKDHDDELRREIQTHLELEAEERVADGMAEADAHYAARRSRTFGTRSACSGKRLDSPPSRF